MDRFDTLIQDLRRRVPQLELREQEPMSSYTTFRIGGPARLIALPRSRKEAIAPGVRLRISSVILPAYRFPGSTGNGSERHRETPGVFCFSRMRSAARYADRLPKRFFTSAFMPLARKSPKSSRFTLVNKGESESGNAMKTDLIS